MRNTKHLTYREHRFLHGHLNRVRHITLDPDGTVLPCQSWLTGKGLGNLLRTPWPRIWHSHECRAIREESAKMAQRCQLGDTPMQEGCR